MASDQLRDIGRMFMAAAIGMPLAWTSAAAQAQVDDSSLSEVLVSASRQGEQSIQSIPMSISVVNPANLNRLGATDLSDLARSVASLSIEESGPGLTKLDIRGISTGAADVVNNLQDRPLIAVYLDDTPLALQGFNPDLRVFDLERVEILRGPQGTLYGASAMGGTIRYITRKPDTQRFFGSSELVTSDTAGGGSVNYGVRGTLNLPIASDRLALLLAGYNGRNSGWIDNVETGEDRINWDRSTQGRAALRLLATDELTLDASVLFEKLDTGGSNLTFSGLGQTKFASLTPTPVSDNLKVYNVTADYGAAWAHIISATSYTTRKIGFNNTSQYITEAYFFPPPPFAGVYVNQNDVRQISQEFRVVSNQTGRFKWIGGAFYDHMIRKNFQDGNTPGFDAAFGALIGDPTFNSLDYGGFAPNSQFSGLENMWEHEVGLFGEVTWTVLPRLDVTGGLRYFDWHEDFYIYYGGVAGALGPGQPLTTQASTSASGANPRFVANFRATDDTIVFVEAAKGFRYGGVNQPVPTSICGAALAAEGLTAAPISFGPDKVWSYSLGEKTTLADNRLRVNATAFLIDWDQVQTEHTLSCSYAYTVNAGAVRSTGGEIEAAYKLTPALTVNVNGSYTHAAAKGGIPNVDATDGARVPLVPKYLASVSAEYVAYLGAQALRFVGEYQYHGDSATQFDPANPLYRRLPAYSNVNAAVSLEYDQWQLGMFVRNLANAGQITSIIPDSLGTQPGDQIAYARPRTIGIRVARDF